MSYPTVFLGLLSVLIACCRGESVGLAEEPASQVAPVDYLRDIKPVLRERCVACHGALQQQAELRLDTVKSMLQGGDSGVALVPGKPEESLLLERIAAQDPSIRMPPEGEPLTSEQLARFRTWIADGAAAPAEEHPEADPREHWAFQPVVRPPVAPREPGEWGRNPIDAFIAIPHERLGLAPQDEAPRSLQIRRLYLDLVGVPPSLEELRRHETDSSADWYERLVETLLDDPRHGERWARHWLDIWRYSDWWGLGSQLRNSQQHIWHWRDWTVESLNADVPYDEMVRLMLAGDELYPTDPRRLRATGYLARNFFIFNRHQWMDETVEHVCKSFLGLTMNCSKCHDHKYDPFPQEDYYRLRAFFEPYHVRTDIVPGQPDTVVDGIPRAFDAELETPTYRFHRGEEGQPDTSKIISPGVPEVLAFRDIVIEPIALPVEAWQPERRPWVFEAYLQASQKQVATAEQALQASGAKLQAARLRESQLLTADKHTPSLNATVAPSTFHLGDNFATLMPERWQPFGGNWEHLPRRMEQKQDGPTRAGLRLLAEVPRDFEATLRFTLLGGSRWRSVSLGFDVTPTNPDDTTPQQDHEQFVYISGVMGGSKVQAAYRQAGKTTYPAAGMRALPIELNREYSLRVQVRDTLINASLDGVPVLAWRTPIARRDGAFQLTTFDALAVFHEVTLDPLDPAVSLHEPATKSSAEPETPRQARQAVLEAEAEHHATELALLSAQAERESLNRRMQALQSRWQLSDATNPDEALILKERELSTAAVKAERAAAAAKALHGTATLELKLLRAAIDQRPAIEKELQTAREKLTQAEALSTTEVKPEDHFSPLPGAKWSPTRFRSSGADDPAPAFPAHSTGRRRALADWITDPENPLTARVAVNHLWSRHLGKPLVPTVFEFGRQGTPPTHPELLDWLAAELIEHGWSMKHLHRLIVTSSTYRLDSTNANREENSRIDGENRYWWRREPIRLESQVIRDTILAHARRLDETRGGPPIPAAKQADSTRRSLYFFHSNNERNMFLTTFDEANVKECYRREQSIVPQQALAMSNSRLVLDAARPIAEGISAAVQHVSPGETDRVFIQMAFRSLLGYAPTSQEVEASLRALKEWRTLPEGTESQARTNYIWVLLNHNDFVTLR